MAFYETPRFPTAISFGSSGGPGYSTDVVVLNSGAESRNQNWSQARLKFDLAPAVKTQALLDTLIAYFRIMKGRTHGFRFQDPFDYTVPGGASSGVFIAIGSDRYQMYVRYTNAAGTEDRLISKPVASTIIVKDPAGTTRTLTTDYTLDSMTGIATAVLAGSPSLVLATWTGQFDVPVRFDTDELRLSLRNKAVYDWGPIPVIEIRV